MITLRSVSVSAPSGEPILRGVDLAVARGEHVALIGASGAGKSTCLRAINGLVRADRGEVIVEGTPIDRHDLVALRRRIGWVIQGAGLLPHMDVAANVGLVPRLLGWPRAKISARVDEVLALVGLEPQRFRARSPASLSGGERQRVAVARAIAAEPPIVLMDEPYGALDPLTRDEVRTDVEALLRRLGATVVVVTHDVVEALATCERVVLMDGGEIVVDAPRERFLGEPRAAAYARSSRAHVEVLSSALGIVS